MESGEVLAAELVHQQRMLERIVRGDPLDRTLNALCRHIEQRFPGSRCTVLLLDRSLGVLRHVASPTLPKRFTNYIDGLPVGEGIGVCGTAAARGAIVIAADILTDPLTQPYTDLARRFKLASVWSYPLSRAGGEVLGTFAVYRAVRHSPTQVELDFVAAAGNLAALAVDRDRSERALQHAVNLDALTGLPNRARFLELVNAELNVERRRVTLAMVQIDRFKQVNQSIGEIAGDRLLLETSERLRGVVAGDGLVARFGGDTFILMTPALEPEAVDELTERVSAAMREPFHADGLELLLSTSIGIATSGAATDAFGLVREADTAIHAARAGGPGRRQVYDLKLRTKQLERLRTEAQLRRAIERDQLVVHYQPILSVEDRSWSGVEALVRWQHPERGLLSPDEFIPLAEETGLIVPLGTCVLEMVCRQARSWARTLPGISIAVNASPVQLAYPTTAAEIKSTVARAHLNPSILTVEVTESALMEELDTAREVLEELEAAGVHVLIDDFGTGYSSLARLGELPISGLKIDRRFTRGLGHDPGVTPIVRAIADLARAYGLKVVVEGIEDGAALASVDALRCEYAQGFHLGRPAPADVIEELLSVPPAVGVGIA
ncbi:MAG TPA: EAL domain-containing protein [Solirubrobacteraceae bacterium]|nr:EAL domain-containing protein [Solirubrobacteraceae bacterium]